MKQYFKIFSIFFCYSSILCALNVYVLRNAPVEVAAKVGLTVGVGFSLLMIAYIAGMNKLFASNVRQKGYDNNPIQERKIELLTDINTARERCNIAIQQLNLKPNSILFEDRKITATTKFSWKSFGEIIVIEIEEIENSKISLNLKSSPRLTTTLADFGKSAENVETILNYLNQNKT